MARNREAASKAQPRKEVGSRKDNVAQTRIVLNEAGRTASKDISSAKIEKAVKSDMKRLGGHRF